MKRLRLPLLVILVVMLLLPSSALAQTYLFSVDQMTVDVFFNEDGTASILYSIVFTNDPSASPIDFVDLGLPNGDYDVNSIQAWVNEIPLDYISRGEYQGSGTGVAIGLEEHAIGPGQTGEVRVIVGTQRDMFYPDSQGDGYASAVFSPTWFGSQYVTGNTRMQVNFHMPPGVTENEPRWHASPAGWPEQPDTGFDNQGPRRLFVEQ